MLSVVRANPELDGEMAATPEWIAEMKAARLAKDLTQTQLGALVGVTQGMISLIEKGSAASSRHILRISRVLDIDPPQFMAFDEEARWLRAGRILRRTRPAKFAALLALVESDTINETDDEG